MNASNELFKTAIICPPDIYGQNTGIGNRTTLLVPEYVKVLLAKKQAFYLGSGENMRGVTHIDDVVDLFLILLEHAVQGGGSAQWGKEVCYSHPSLLSTTRLTIPKGFYFAVSDEVKWIEAAEAINKLGIKQGWLPANSNPVSWTKEQVGGLLPGRSGLVLYLWGSNSRAESARAKKLGWKPHGPSFWEALEEDVTIAVTKAKI
jgi:nucleoside-diphosphate-sugar epimerase